MTRNGLGACIVLASGLAFVAPGAGAAEYSERFSVSFGGFQPSGPAPLGTLVSVNYGGRLTESLRVGAEISWYRRSYETTFLFVDDPSAAPGSPARGVIIDSVATTQILPILGTADYYFPMRSGDLELYFGGGAGADFFSVEHFPLANLRSFDRKDTGLGYMVRVGLSTRPGRTVGAMFVEVFYKGSSISADEDLVSGRGADLDTRSKGPGFRVGFRF